MTTHAAQITLLSLALSACAGSVVPLSPHAQARLAAPAESAGALVYVGQVVPQGQTDAAFTYERRVQKAADGALVSTHLTYDASTEARVVAWRAEHTADYELRKFEEIQAQTGVVSSVQVLDDGGLRFSVTRGQETEQHLEPAGDAVVVGPTIVGFVLVHWDELLAGGEIPVRFAAADQGRTFDFTLALEQATPTRVTIKFVASSFFIRLGIAPISMIFDRETKIIQRYIGRVPPRLEGLSTFDATVDYEFAAASYR